MSPAQPFALLYNTHGGQLEAAGIEVEDGYSLLQTICERFPNRVTGSVGEKAQGEYLAEVLKQSGLTDITLDPVECLSFEVDCCELRFPDSDSPEIEALPLSFTGSTPPEGITAPLLYADNINFVDLSEQNLKGKILMLYGDFSGPDRLPQYKTLCDNGLAGIICIPDREWAVCLNHHPAAVGYSDIPVLYISHADGEKIIRSGATTGYMKVKMNNKGVTGHNLVGCLPANQERIDDKVIIVTAHMDAKPVSEAAADNGTGTTMAVAVLQTLAKADRRRDVWFVGYTSEEHQQMGSRQFPLDHPEIVSRCMLQCYYDGHGGIVGINKLQVTGEDALAEFMKAVATDINHPMDSNVMTITLDPRTLFSYNVPAVRILRFPQRTWHTKHDVIEGVAPQMMRAGVHLYAEAIYRLVNIPDIPFKLDVPTEAVEYSKDFLSGWVPRTIEEAQQGVKEGFLLP